MKATGIVRRIDDLGRIVIPKEIRRTMHIRDGDPLEIFVGSGEIVFRKYSLMGELESFVSAYAETLHKDLNLPVAICDTEHVIASSGIPKKELESTKTSTAVLLLMENRATYVMENGNAFFPVDGYGQSALIVIPILCSGDVLGALIVFGNEAHGKPTDTEVKMSKLAANLIAKQAEED